MDTGSRKQNGTGWLVAAGILWLTGVCVGFRALGRKTNTPGAEATPPQYWPMRASLPRSQKAFTLLMLAHPHCPCTRASLGELARLMTLVGDRLNATVLFLQPSDQPSDWTQTDLWRSAAAIPGVRVIADPDGREARRFQARTSGQTLVYEAQGRLVFSGGITAARGHFGDNEGRSAIVALARQQTRNLSRSPVFGCALFARPFNGQNP